MSFLDFQDCPDEKDKKDEKTLLVGPRGGTYYMKNDKKVYCKFKDTLAKENILSKENISKEKASEFRLKAALDYPEILKQQIIEGVKTFATDQDRINLLKDVDKYKYETETDRYLMELYFSLENYLRPTFRYNYENITQEVMQIFTLYSSSSPKKTIKLIKKLSALEDQFTFLGEIVDTKEKVFVKWDLSSDTSDELFTWEKVKGLGVKTPFVTDEFLFLGDTAMVMELLYPLDPLKDNPFQVGLDVLEILSIIHTIGVHSDIKPDNILRDSKGKYHLVDYGLANFRKEENSFGFKRKGGTEGYALQPLKLPVAVITSAKYDLLELIRTIHSLVLQGTTIKNWQTLRLEQQNKYLENMKEVDGKFALLLSECYELVMNQSEDKILKDTYSVLKKKLQYLQQLWK